MLPTKTLHTLGNINSRKQKRKRADEDTKIKNQLIVPTVNIDDPERLHTINDLFEKYQAVYIPNAKKDAQSNDEKDALHWKDMHDIFHNLNKKDKESFCVENDDSTKDTSFLNKESNGYCSFLIQNDKDALEHILPRLPLKDILDEWNYEPCLWIFFGRNKSNKDLQGRPEHTDQISHHGTWHYQLSGRKQWFLRPTSTLIRQFNSEDSNDEGPICIDCQEGDVIIVNTRLWKHQTIIPAQTHPSVSYARDFWMNNDAKNCKDQEADNKEEAGMTNVDGLYAMDDIEENTIIFTEDDMPECELHRSKDANCKIVELADGTQAVLSRREIRAGEFFCVAHSSDEEDFESDDDGSDDDDDANIGV